MVDYDETTETKASAVAEAREAYRGLSISLSSSSDSTACCTPPSPSAGPLISVVDLSISNSWDRDQQHQLEGLRHRHQGKIILTDMTPALHHRQRSGNNNGTGGTSSSTISSVTTPPDSPLHLLLAPSSVGEEQAAATLDEDRLLLPQSALSSSPYQYRYPPHRSWIRTVWIVHLVICVLVIFISVWSNQDSRKYIIIDPQKVDGTCKRVFVNVMASSPDEKDAIICCEPLKSGGGKRRLPTLRQQQLIDQHELYPLPPPLWINQHVLNREDDIYDDNDNTKDDEKNDAAWTTITTGTKRLRQQFLDICPQPRATRVRLPFVNRLAKFPDAWLLPLFPLLIRMCLRLYQSYLEPESPTPSPSASAASASKLSSSSSSRQPFYARYYYKNSSSGGGGGGGGDTTFGIYTFRRLLLYFMIMLFRGAFLFMALNGIEDQIARHDSSTIGAKTCWYSSLLKESQPDCYGRIFDFSDHIVLYFAQLLPIALLEYLHSLERPYWPFRCFRKRALPVLLTCAMLYLYTLVFVGVYKTASYFHTTSEIIAGFCVSLIAMLPLGWVQCSESPRGRALRFFFFGRTDPPCNYEKLSPSISASSLTP